jgi:thioredoxin-like negative regulator of GroEL
MLPYRTKGKKMLKFNRYSMVSLLVMLTGLAPTSAMQEQIDPNLTEQAIDEQQSTLKPSTTKRLYLAQQKKRTAKQKGPRLGSPKSIIPEPFIASKSIKIPAPTLNGQTTDTPELTTGEADDNTQNSLSAEQNDNFFLSQSLTNQYNNDENPVNPNSRNKQETSSFYEEGDLGAFDPSSLSILDKKEGLETTFWNGYDREAFIARLLSFKDIAGSPAMDAIVRQIVLSSSDIPATDSELDIDNTIKAQLSILSAKGKANDYQTLIENLPKDRDWSTLAKEIAQAHLLASRLSHACEIAETQRKADNSPYWLRLSAFCEAAHGNRSAVDFQLGILEEATFVEPTFYRLIDHILIEAEENSAGSLRETSQLETLEGALELNILEAAMARLARVQINEFKLENVNPMAVGMMLSIPSISQDAKATLIQIAIQQDWLTATELGQFYSALNPSDDDKTAAISLATVDDTSEKVDATLTNLVATDTDETIRLNALESAWLRAAQAQTTSTSGPVFAKLTTDISPSSSLGNKAALFVRINLLEGNLERSLQWLRTLRAQSTNNDPTIDIALQNMWPLMVTIMGNKPKPEQFNIWWNTQTERSDRFERASLLLSTMEAQGIFVPAEMWGVLEKGPATLNGEVPSPAIWRAFLLAVQKNDKPLALLYAFRLLSPKQNGVLSPSLIGSILGNLREMGFEQETKMLATEILIAQGL